MRKYVSISGTMGIGKTTLVRFIADNFGLTPVLENFKQNPFLSDFYKDMKRWAFHSQTFFLLEKSGQLHDLTKLLKKSTVVQDTPVVEDVYGYAYTLHKLKHISLHEWDLYHRIYKRLEKQSQQPAFIIHLTASVETIFNRINQRDRAFETGTKKREMIEYLTCLHDSNDLWVKRIGRKIPVEVINIDDFDYRKDGKNREQMKTMITNMFKKYKLQ